jgi:hypothetical protein
LLASPCQQQTVLQDAELGQPLLEVSVAETTGAMLSDLKVGDSARLAAFVKRLCSTALHANLSATLSMLSIVNRYASGGFPLDCFCGHKAQLFGESVLSAERIARQTLRHSPCSPLSIGMPPASFHLIIAVVTRLDCKLSSAFTTQKCWDACPVLSEGTGMLEISSA